jgi:hypothetical protein
MLDGIYRTNQRHQILYNPSMKAIEQVNPIHFQHNQQRDQMQIPPPALPGVMLEQKHHKN